MFLVRVSVPPLYGDGEAVMERRTMSAAYKTRGYLLRAIQKAGYAVIGHDREYTVWKDGEQVGYVRF